MNDTDHEKLFRHIISELALLGLLAEIINPTCQLKKAEAERIIFSSPPSKELKRIAELFGEDVQTLYLNICELLKGAGYNQNTNYPFH